MLPISRAASNDLPQQVIQLQTRMMETNGKIAALTSEQLKSAETISGLQARLTTAQQEIDDLSVFKPDQSSATAAEIHRTANGHGRGGR